MLFLGIHKYRDLKAPLNKGRHDTDSHTSWPQFVELHSRGQLGARSVRALVKRHLARCMLREVGPSLSNYVFFLAFLFNCYFMLQEKHEFCRYWNPVTLWLSALGRKPSRQGLWRKKAQLDVHSPETTAWLSQSSVEILPCVTETNMQKSYSEIFIEITASN